MKLLIREMSHKNKAKLSLDTRRTCLKHRKYEFKLLSHNQLKLDLCVKNKGQIDMNSLKYSNVDINISIFPYFPIFLFE